MTAVFGVICSKEMYYAITLCFILFVCCCACFVEGRITYIHVNGVSCGDINLTFIFIARKIRNKVKCNLLLGQNQQGYLKLL